MHAGQLTNFAKSKNKERKKLIACFFLNECHKNAFVGLSFRLPRLELFRFSEFDSVEIQAFRFRENKGGDEDAVSNYFVGLCKDRES